MARSRRESAQRPAVILSLGGAGGAIDISQRSNILAGIAAIKAQLEAAAQAWTARLGPRRVGGVGIG